MGNDDQKIPPKHEDAQTLTSLSHGEGSNHNDATKQSSTTKTQPERNMSSIDTVAGSDDDEDDDNSNKDTSSQQKPSSSLPSSSTPVSSIPENKTTGSSNPDSDKNEDNDEKKPSIWIRLLEFYRGNEFLILVICAILIARAYPPLGATYLAPDITATWIAVCIIFVFAGLGLKTNEFTNAFQKIGFNLLIQGYNFGFISAVVFAVTRGLEAANILSQDLADGMVVSSCLPMTINMVLVLTKASGGDESLAIVNAAAGNLIGVFLSPVLILGYLGVTGDINLVDVFYKLALRVVLPVAVGQFIQKSMPTVVEFYKEHKKRFKKFQEYCLVFIVYTVFCSTFSDDNEDDDSTVGDIFLMILFVFLFLVSFMAVAWIMLGIVYPNQPEMRVMGLFGCTHKTVAMGVPLINAIYESNPAVGLYTLPLLIWHPMQLVIGTFLAPRLAAFVEREKERLGIDSPPSTTPPEDQPMGSSTSSNNTGTEENAEQQSDEDQTKKNDVEQGYASKTEAMNDEPSAVR